LQFLDFLELKRICDKHDIRYTPVAGTLIGAVRHQGFIPWDNDMDIGMLREDYDRFVEIAKSELRPEFFLQTVDTDPNFFHPIARICLQNTISEPKWAEGVAMHHGIYIDIFPYDNSPNGKLQMMSHKYLLWFLKIVNSDRHKRFESKTLKAKIGLPLIRLLAFPFSDEKIEKMLSAQIQKYNKINTEYVVPTSFLTPYERIRIQRKSMEEFVSLQFEEINIPVMRGYHEHLSNIFGDYMTPPPKESICDWKETYVKVSFGPYGEDSYLERALQNYLDNE